MKMSGSRQIEAPQADVWSKLNDIDVLKRCIPGCESLEKAGENDLKSTVAVKIGPMNVKFSGAVTLSDLNPPASYRISGKGQGGAAGFASGGANVHLEPKGGGTLLTYDVDATVGGKIAQLGARLIDATAASLANQFFDRFAAEMAPAAAAATTPVASAESLGEPAGARGARSVDHSSAKTTTSGHVPVAKSGTGWMWWSAAVALVALAIIWLLRQPFS
jgi:uncharacterized protein